MNSKLKRYLLLVLAFGLGFLLALALARNIIRDETPRGGSASILDEPPRKLDETKLTNFLRAAEKGDYAAMETTGPDVFHKGVLIPDAATRFEPYAANSFPPFTVYAFYSAGSDDRVRRVLLTLDAENRVESFLAEEMTVMK